MKTNELSMFCISDLHHFTDEELEAIEYMEYDVCLLLGDIPQRALRIIKKANGSRSLYGICGNHDDWNSLESVGIEDIHCKVIEVNGIKIAGLGGSHRYKNGDYAMLTQKESIEAVKSIPYADILISHDCPYKLFGKIVTHNGLKGISRYISKHRPQLNLCGHYHESMKGIYKKCRVECVYRFENIVFSSSALKRKKL